ncbi:MAG: AAA family ATPase [Candidatus Paceibacterota bacterium]|jgi:chromosome segregation protein
MYLKSLELSGFKSFAKKASLQFNSPITAIVGPNGSGKSNVAEAFRFVLGEQSIKSLRGKRGEDMIWNGGGDMSSSAGRANRASVKLIFDNSRRFFPTIDFDEISLERVVHRDNANEYLLNGSQVRLKDIVELLASAHIGSTGHHIISQGEADRILSASIHERREMVEDALGLKIYQWKKLESIRKLEHTDENMKQVESLRREIAPHLKFLKKQVEKVEKAEELRKELVILCKEYFSVEEYYLRTERQRLLDAIAPPKNELQELDNALSIAKKILTDSKTADKKSGEVVILEEKLKSIRVEKDSIMRELGRLEGEINANKRAIEKEKEKQKRDEFKTIYLKDLEDVVTGMESLRVIDDVKKLWSEVMLVLKGFITRHRSINDSSLIGEAEKDIQDLLRQKNGLEIKLQVCTDSEVKIVREYETLKNVIEKEKDTNRDAEKDVFKIIARQNDVRNTVFNLTTKLESLDYGEATFKTELIQAGTIAGREAIEYGKYEVRSMNYEEVEQWRREIRGIQEERRRKIEKSKIRLEDSGGSGGSEVMKEYKETEERDVFLARELLDLEKSKEELLRLITELDMRIDIEFKSGIMKINTEFHKFFSLMFGGGRAELSVIKEIRRKKKSETENLGDLLSDTESLSGLNTDNQDNESDGPEGLEVNISLPKKKVKGLMMLSGGERALTSIALLFAISQVNPPPFIILDETDAALDEANSRKYSDMIENLSKQSQLILITHNRETMSRAGVIYGVTMGADGASKLLSIAFEEAVAVAK